MRYLTAEEVIYFREYLVHRYFPEGGKRPMADRPIDMGLLESALVAPAHSFEGQEFYPRLHQKAACLFRSVAKNHAFMDGNKRTAVVATMMFLLMNFRILLAVPGEMYDLAQRVATSTDNDKIMAELTDWFRRRVFPRWG